MGKESFKCLEKEWTLNVKYNATCKINESAGKLRKREGEGERKGEDREDVKGEERE